MTTQPNTLSASDAAAAADMTRGYAAAVGSYLIWGFVAPFYFKAVGFADPAEIISHRIVWTVAVMGALVLAIKPWTEIVAAIDTRRKFLTFCVTTLLVTSNWSIFVYGVATNRLVEVSLGYFINPLVNVALGVAFLSERLTKGQGLAVAIAASGVAVMVEEAGSFPWISIALALSFGLYALVRKKERVDPLTGLLVETALLFPFCLGYLFWLGGDGHFMTGTPNGWMLFLAGPMTAVPLVLFMYAGQRLSLSTLGLLQYIGPTGHLALGVLVYGEAFTSAHAIAFPLIWLALVVYTGDSWRRHHLAKRQPA